MNAIPESPCAHPGTRSAPPVESLTDIRKALVGKLLLFVSFEDAEDAAQDAMIRYLAHGGHELHSPHAWLNKVAFRRAATIVRRERRYEALSAAEPEAQPDDREEREEFALRLTALNIALGNLAVHLRSAILACYVGGKTQAQAAGEAGVSIGAMNGRLTRGRDAVRLALRSRGFDIPD